MVQTVLWQWLAQRLAWARTRCQAAALHSQGAAARVLNRWQRKGGAASDAGAGACQSKFAVGRIAWIYLLLRACTAAWISVSAQSSTGTKAAKSSRPNQRHRQTALACRCVGLGDWPSAWTEPAVRASLTPSSLSTTTSLVLALTRASHPARNVAVHLVCGRYSRLDKAEHFRAACAHPHKAQLSST